jgi:hypothetical protein
LFIGFLFHHGLLSPLASSHPDGLEWVAGQHGFIEVAREAVYNIIPDYTMPGIVNPALATTHDLLVDEYADMVDLLEDGRLAQVQQEFGGSRLRYPPPGRMALMAMKEKIHTSCQK